MKKQLQKLLSILLCFVMLIGLLPTTVFAASTQAAQESYAVSITNKPGTTFELGHDSTSNVCDLWNEIDSDGTGELAFSQSFSININDAIDVYNNWLDTKYPDRENYKASEDIHNGSTFYVEARIWINNDNDFRFINKAGYMLAPYGLDGEKNDGCGEWYLYSSNGLSEEFFTMSIDSTQQILNFELDGTVKEIYEALKTQNEALGDVTIDSLMFDVWVSCEVEYYNSWGDISYTELHFESLEHTLYDKHIYESASEYDTLSAIPITAPLTANVVPAYEGCYEPVKTEYNWYYEFIKEGYDTDEDDTWYGYFERDESKESDVLTETAPSGNVFGVAYGTVDSGDKNYITLNDILNENNKAFINSFIGAKPRELGGNSQMFIGCDVTLTFADGKQWVVGVTKADYMSKLISPCMHACTVCGFCTVTDEMLPCNFDQMSYEIGNVCICDEPSVPEFKVTVKAESQMTIESTETIVNVVVEKIEVEETPTHSFIVNTTDAVGADNVIALYNINVFDEAGYPYTLNQWYDEGEELTVSVPVSMEEALALQSGEAALYHILADGTAEEVEGVTVAIEGEPATMTFTSDSFSPFILARSHAFHYYGRAALSALTNSTALLYAYNQLAAGVETSAETITVYNGTNAITQAELEMVMDAYRRDYAHHFWLGNSYHVSGDATSVVSIKPTYTMTGTDLETAKTAFEQKVTDILSGITSSMSEYEKELYLHDKLAETVTYEEGTNAHNAYGALVGGKAVCEGYAEALQYLLQRVGIQSFLAVGTSINPATNTAENHEWNYVKIDGKYYHVDLTWDDQGENLFHAYFNQSDTVIQEDHTISTTGYALPVCDSTIAQYFTGKDEYLDIYTAETVGKLLKDNDLKVHVYIPGTVNDFISWYETNIADIGTKAGITGGFSYGYAKLGRELILNVLPASVTTYTVTVTGGTASPAGPNAEGTEVTITATPPANMGFKQWNGLDGVTFVDDTNKQSATATFKMPARAVEATAVYGINNVTATATGNIKPVLGNNAETNPTFTYNFAELTTMSNSCWRYSSDGEEWEYAGYTEATKKFCVGYWYFDLNARLNGLSISDPCTVTVNGTKWQIIRPSVNLAAESPVYYLDAEGNVSVVMFEIDGVTATCPAMPDSLSAEDTLPHLAFTPTPTQAVVRGDGTWQKKSGDNWVNVSGAAEAGKTYRYKTKMHIDSSATTHTFTGDVTLKVNGTSWTVDYTTMQETGTSSVSVMVYSPEYTVAETYTVFFAANGGTSTMADETGISGEYELPACAFTAPANKQFKAWSVGGVEKAVGDKITVTADTTVTAVWETVSEYTKKGDISAVEATAVLPPVLGATTYTSVTITDPTDAAAKGVIISGTSWYKKDASSIYGWTQCSNGVDTFEEGTYRLSVQLRSKSNEDKEYYAMSGDTTFTVNGVQWNSEEPFRDYYASDGYGYRFFVSPEFTLGGKTLDSIAVTTPPTKTAYREGEDFSPAGMVVIATYTDSTTAPVVLYTVTDGTDMAAGKTSVTISYTEGGVTETTTQAITVAKEYTVTVEGGTGNGKHIAGEAVTISAFVSTGMQFKEWQGTDGLTFTSGDKNSQTATFTMPAHDVTITAATGPAEYYVSVTGGSGTGMYETGEIVTIVADPPEAGKQFKTWVVGDGKVLRFTESDITSSTAKFQMPGEAVRIEATYEDIPAPKTSIDTVNISDLAKPVVGEMPDNSITVSGTGVTVDDEGSYWGRFVSPRFSPVYDDDITVDSVVFRDGEIYMFQLYLNAEDGYEFTSDSKFYFAGELLPAPDMDDLSKSFAMVNPEDSTVALIYINMNDIAHIHAPGDWDSNDTHHWHKCTASGCDAGTDVSRLPDYAEHSFVNGLCTCGAHKHSWSAEWSVNETHHWHECSANGCTVTDNSGKDGYAAHVFTAGACVCGVENVIASIEISGITAPVVGATPINSATVDKIGAEVDEEGTFWVRYDTSAGRTSDTYADGASVSDTPFRDGETYLLQIMVKPKTGYSFTADTKILYGDAELSAPDVANPTASCGAIAPDYSMAMALINPNGASAPLTYTVSFAANGGTGTMADVTGVSGEYTLPACTFTAPANKRFKAWSVGGDEKAVGDKITVTANTTVTAVWEDIPVTTYTITFNANGGSVTPASAPTNTEGKLTRLPTPTRSGSYSFKGWYTATSGGTKVTTSTVFNANTTIYAQWTYTGGGGVYVPVSYTNTVTATQNGDVSVSPKSAVKGETITVTIVPDNGYTLETLTVSDKNGKKIELTNKGDGEYTFKMPASKVTVTATFMDDNTMLNFFVDVPTDAYYHDAVLWAAKAGITNGTSATTFSPDAPCTRAHMVTFLWRAAGSPEPTANVCIFTDVDMDSYYGKAVLWAVEIGIINGTSATTFSPNDPCTRAHMATILFRLEDGKAEGTENMFTDVKSDAYYAEAVQWAVEQTITNGMTATAFGPNEVCTRAHMATFMYRYFVK